MRISTAIFLSILSLLLFATPAWTQPATSPDVEARISKLLKQMTLEEKVGQLNTYSANSATGPGTGRRPYPEMIVAGHVGAMFNVVGAREVNEMQRLAMEKSRLHIPMLFGLDVIHGYRTEFPVPLAMAATWDPKLIENAAHLAARESRADGINWVYSPMLDIVRDARWGRIVESEGEDPYLGAAIARAYIRGYQGTEPTAYLAACAKHFVGYGAAEGGRDYNTTEISEHTLREVYLRPFHAAEQQGVLSFMAAFNSLNGVPASANPFTLRQVLRKEWGFKGMVVGDWESVKEVMEHGIANDGATAALKAFKAGVTSDMQDNLYELHLADLVRSGAISKSELDDAVRDVLRVKFALGLFERPYADEAHPVFTGPIPEESRALARQAAESSFVLLKNSGAPGKPVLPLGTNTVHTIALIGPLADNAASMLGSWQGQGRANDVVTLRSALEQYAGAHNLKVDYVQACVSPLASVCDTEKAVQAAHTADVVLLAVGEDGPERTGEASSVASLDIPGGQLQLVREVENVGKPSVLLLFSGRPLTFGELEPKLSAILEAWFPGVEAGPALVRTLFGEANPSGRLTVTFPRTVGQEPLYYNALSTGRPAEGVDLSRPPLDSDSKYVSRYVDETNAPAYPFGYGLSYTNFEYSAPQLSSTSTSADALNQRKPDAAIRVTASVRNAGSVSGAEVVQLYIRRRGTSVTMPVRELKGFQKIALAPGESKTVTFTLGRDELAFWNIDMKELVEPEQVSVWVAHDSASGTPVKFEIRQ
ncbi:MAG TPA: beta-glucosidase BglX [Candidatus Acidoferrales bacterium]|nr:beta-glucosidase BglX [Candidatus Acidoferrales bacterium]